MIHLGPILYVASGVGLGFFSERIRFKKIRFGRKLQRSANPRPGDPDDVMLAVAEPGRGEARSTTRFALSTGMMGLSMTAQFAAPALIPITLISVGFMSKGIYKEAGEAVFKDRRIKVDILDAVVISLTAAFRQIAAVGFMVWVLDIADLLLARTRARSERFITDIFGTQPRFAWRVQESGEEVETAIQDLQAGDVIVVNTGEQIPVDGVVVGGTAMIDQQSLTGESAPVERNEGDQAYAMTVLVAGRLQIQVEQTGADTVAFKIVKIINDAASFKVDVQSSGERIADKMVLPTLGLGTLGYFTAGPGGMLAIINADFGTGIRVAAPIALLAALGRSAQHGVLIKDSKVFETIKKVDAVLFDKTGTLTYDVPRVARVVCAGDDYTEETIIAYTAAAEQKFSHPIAKALLNKAEELGLALPAQDDSRYHVGLGIEVVVDARHIKVGSARYLQQEGITCPPVIAEALEASQNRGHSAILIAIEDVVAGLIELKATVRDEAIQVIASLRQRGVKEIVLISGDHEAPTRELASHLQVDRYFGGVMPHEKADYVKLLQSEGKTVMMVGDGINDSAALSLADIGVSLQGASTIAIDVADVVFMDGHLEKFDYLFDVTTKLQSNVRRSFALIAIPNTLCIFGGLTGLFGLSASLVLNNGFNLISAVNAAMVYNEAKAETTVPLPEVAEAPELTAS
ncbi:MAG: heavy metal translocating P-type ATPase [Thiohalocapsa sp.]